MNNQGQARTLENRAQHRNKTGRLKRERMLKDIPGCQNVENGQLLHSSGSCSGRRSERTAEAAVPSRSVGIILARLLPGRRTEPSFEAQPQEHEHPGKGKGKGKG
jgi:hypothetical protein